MTPTPNEAIRAIGLLAAAAALAHRGDPRAAEVATAGDAALGEGLDGEPLDLGLHDVIAAAVGGALAVVEGA